MPGRSTPLCCTLALIGTPDKTKTKDTMSLDYNLLYVPKILENDENVIFSAAKGTDSTIRSWKGPVLAPYIKSAHFRPRSRVKGAAQSMRALRLLWATSHQVDRAIGSSVHIGFQLPEFPRTYYFIGLANFCTASIGPRQRVVLLTPAVCT